MSRLGDWDKVEKKPKPISFTRSDELWEYFKLLVLVAAGLVYLWYIFKEGIKMKKAKRQKSTQRPARGQYHGVEYPRTDGKRDGKKSLRKND